VVMRDGVHLATDVYRLAVDGRPVDTPLPVILERTPYNKRGTSRTERSVKNPAPKTREELAIHYVRRGFIVVWQDCRGRYDSEGTFVKYLSEGEDGYDTMQWLVSQPWTNGMIGTQGLSY